MRYYTKDNNYSTDGIKVHLPSLPTWSETDIIWSSQNTDGAASDNLGYVLDDGYKKNTSPTKITDSPINSSIFMYF